jgi:hypothetical protein
VETAEQIQGGGLSDSEEDGGWTEEEEVLGTDEDIPDDAAATTTVTSPAHAGAKRTHEQQQALQQAAGVPAAQKRARLPPGRDAQCGDRDDEEEEEAVKTPKLKRTLKGGHSSELVGVCWNKSTSKWRAQRMINGKKVYLGEFAKEEDAARAYNDFVQHGTRNVIPNQKGSTSKFRGVCWHKASNRWRAQRVINGKNTYLGDYAKEEDAARAFNDFVQHGTRNVVPRQGTPHGQQQEVLQQAAGVPAAQKRGRLSPGRYADMQEGARGEEEEEAANTAELKKKKGGNECSSTFIGVSWNKDMNKWLAQRMIGGKNTNLGYYATRRGRTWSTASATASTSTTSTTTSTTTAAATTTTPGAPPCAAAPPAPAQPPPPPPPPPRHGFRNPPHPSRPCGGGARGEVSVASPAPPPS